MAMGCLAFPLPGEPTGEVGVRPSRARIGSCQGSALLGIIYLGIELKLRKVNPQISIYVFFATLLTEWSQEYWQNVRHLEFFQKLELEEEDFATCIPISWHTDGVKIYRSQKAWVYSYAACTRKGPSLESKLLFMLFRDCQMVKPDTHDETGLLVAWCMDVLRTGNFPECQYGGAPWPDGSLEAKRAGMPYAGGWKAAFAAFKADLEARAMVHKMVRNWASNSICEHCLASKVAGLTFGDFTETAAYLNYQLSHDEFLELNPPDRQSTWIHVKGWTKDRNLDVTRPYDFDLEVFFLVFASLPKICSPQKPS